MHRKLRSMRKRTAIVLAATLAVVLGGAGLAWAQFTPPRDGDGFGLYGWHNVCKEGGQHVRATVYFVGAGGDCRPGELKMAIPGGKTLNKLARQVEEIETTPGEKGDPGDPGAPGASAYEVAVANGFEGTEEEWLASLEGDKGDQGDPGDQGVPGDKGDPGDPGSDGQDGVSGYEVVGRTADAVDVTAGETATVTTACRSDNQPAEAPEKVAIGGGAKVTAGAATLGGSYPDGIEQVSGPTETDPAGLWGAKSWTVDVTAGDAGATVQPYVLCAAIASE